MLFVSLFCILIPFFCHDSYVNFSFFLTKNLHTSSNALPRPTPLSSLRPHGSSGAGAGIYHCDVFGSDLITTCSKDGSIVVNQFTPTGLRGGIATMEGYHGTAVVKHVAHSIFDGRNCLASCGNDKRINVFDIRNQNKGGSGANVITFNQSLHSLAVNTVAWSPLNPFQLLSSSFDCQIHLLDLRASARGPLHTLNKHFPRAITRAPAMFHPIYIEGGAFVMAASTSNSLFVYSALTGELVRTLPIGYSSQQLCEANWEGKESSFVTYSKRLIHRMKFKVRQ